VDIGLDLVNIFLRKTTNATELVHFRKRIGVEGFNLIFKMSVALHGKQAQASSVLIDTTASEKNITYPTDAKLAIDKFQTSCVWEVCVAIL
jgi:predicted acyltransferase (DUF342 family)